MDALLAVDKAIWEVNLGHSNPFKSTGETVHGYQWQSSTSLAKAVCCKRLPDSTRALEATDRQVAGLDPHRATQHSSDLYTKRRSKAYKQTTELLLKLDWRLPDHIE